MRLVVDIRKKLGSFTLSSTFESEDMITGLLGASGCGKSLALKCIAGIETPDEGYIELDGRVLFDSRKGISIRPQERHVGYLFQSYALFPTMSVRKNIMTGVHSIRDRAERRRRYEAAVELMQLEGLEEHRPYQLSGGQAQRAALARIIASQPELLLLDEPFSALDTHLKDSLQVDMKRLIARLGKQTVLVTHSVSEAFRLCSRICVMESGSIIRAGRPAEVYSNPMAEGCAKLFGHRNIFSFRKDGGLIVIPELGISLEKAEAVPEGADRISITDAAITAGGTIRVSTEDVLSESDGNNLILSLGGKRSLWWKSSLCSVDSISIDTARCVFLG